jgi:hypothetical protein
MKYGTGFISLVVLFWATQSSAQVVMSASCSEPVGVRYDQVKGKTERNDDGFSGGELNIKKSTSFAPNIGYRAARHCC